MKTQRAKILLRAAELAAEVETLHGGAWRSRVNPIREEEGPVAVITPVSDVPVTENLSFIDWKLTFQVMIFARGSVPDDAADGVIAGCYEAIMSDTALAGMVIDLSPRSISFQTMEGDKPIGVTSLEFTCQYRTDRTCLTRLEVRP